MVGTRFHLSDRRGRWLLPVMVLAGLLSSWNGLKLGAIAAAQEVSPMSGPELPPGVAPRPLPAVEEPTLAPGAEPMGPEAGPVLPEPALPAPPGPIVHELGPAPYPPGPPSREPPPTVYGPPPPGAICRPIPTVFDAVAALGVTVTWPVEGGGVLVLDVIPGSPAADAGLLRGDRILAINHQLMSTPSMLACYIRRKLSGSRIWIAYWRHGGIQTTNTILAPTEAIPGAKPQTRPIPIWQADRAKARPVGPETHNVVLTSSTPR